MRIPDHEPVVGAASTSSPRTGNVARAVLLGGLLLLLARLLLDPRGAASEPTFARPSLPAIDARCREPRERALAWAREAEIAANARVERYPFVPSAGVPALELIAQAESCARLAEHAALAERYLGLWRAVRARLERDLQAALDRYEIAQRRGKPSELRADIELLLELLEREDTPFTQSLRRELAELIEASWSEP